VLKGRIWSTEEYRYGFQNQEQDDELWEGAVSFNYRVEDARIGRFFSMDPIRKGNQTPFSFAANNPILCLEVEGLDSMIVHRTRGVIKDGVVHYKLTFSIVKKGVEKVLPLVLYQAANANFVLIPDNVAAKMRFENFRGASRDEGNPYYYAIRVYNPKKKSNGENFEIFMHPTSYQVNPYLLGCLSTYWSLESDGTPLIDDGSFGGDMQVATGSVLELIYSLYEKFEIGDLNGVFKGNDFFMQTNSEVSPPSIDKISSLEGEVMEKKDGRNLQLMEVQPIKADTENTSNHGKVGRFIRKLLD
jgi:RHS repeat-associated protein